MRTSEPVVTVPGVCSVTCGGAAFTGSACTCVRTTVSSTVMNSMCARVGDDFSGSLAVLYLPSGAAGSTPTAMGSEVIESEWTVTETGRELRYCRARVWAPDLNSTGGRAIVLPAHTDNADFASTTFDRPCGVAITVVAAV